MNHSQPISQTRRRLPLWGGIFALIILFPAIVIPILLNRFGEPAFQSIDEIQNSQVREIEIFVLNRPDGGPDIGAVDPYRVRPDDFPRTLELLRDSKPVPFDSSRGIWLGRIVVTLANGRKQTIMLHRPKDEYNDDKVQRVMLRVGQLQFVGPEVNQFTKTIGEIAGAEPAPEPDPLPKPE